MNHPLDQWFANDILPHEAALMRYLYKVWRSPAEVPDLRQETYVRVFESAAKSRPRSPRSFLFATARNLMIDRMRRDRIVSIDYTHDLNALDVPVDQLSPERRLGARQELQCLAEAFDRLPETTRSVIWLRRVEGLSQRQTAEKLGIQESTLEGHMVRGLRTLANILLSKVTTSDEQAALNQPNREAEHGQRSD
jgi:RNA polymerase sigma factor (sigma-70 family)